MNTISYDGYNQSAHDEVSMPLRAANSGSEGNDAAVKVAIGFKAGQSANGGLGEEREVAPTLSHQPSALEPTVASFVRIGSMTRRERPTPPSEEVAQPLSASDGNIGDNAPVVIERLLAAMRYIVRRLTPTECERLQGIPDGYTIPLGLDPNDQTLVAEFQRIFDTFNSIMHDYAHAKWEREGRKGDEPKPPKPKSAKQVAAWLAKISDPATCPDSPRYKSLGNGMATNQVRWIFTRLLTKEGVEW